MFVVNGGIGYVRRSGLGCIEKTGMKHSITGRMRNNALWLILIYVTIQVEERRYLPMTTYLLCTAEVPNLN